MKDLILRPHLSEQTYAQSQDRVYVFNVPTDANKHTVARAVAAQFAVTVESVNMSKTKGKTKRTISLTGRRRGLADGVRSDSKKAYVKLAEGNSLPIFAAIEEGEKKEEAAQEQAEKAMAKQLKSQAKQSTRTPRGSAVTRLFKKQGDK